MQAVFADDSLNIRKKRSRAQRAGQAEQRSPGIPVTGRYEFILLSGQQFLLAAIRDSNLPIHKPDVRYYDEYSPEERYLT